MADTNAVQIQCPNCGNTYQAPVRSIIDVGQNPELRQAFLAGQINLAVCPKCHAGGLLEVPLVYHDPAAEFLAIYFPQQLSIPELEKHKMVGELTQGLMRSLPPDQRKGYFLSPRQFVSRQALMDAVLGTMGVSQEELDRQRKKLKLIDQLRVMADDPKGLEMMLKGQDAQVDYEFFVLLSGSLERAQNMGDEKTANQLQMLNDQLLKLTTYGKKVAKQEAAVESLKDLKTPEEFYDRVIEADMDVIDAVVVAARPAFDYAFFQKLSAEIDSSTGPARDRLVRLRERILELTQQMDESARASVKESTALLQELLASTEPRSAVREHAAEIDDVFMAVLSANMQEAERRGSKAALERMRMIYDEIMALLEEAMPPEVQFVNNLLRASYPDGTRALLQEHKAEVTPEMIELIGSMADEMAEREGPDMSETAKRLRDIRAQAMLLV